jgi:alpha-galactosidase
MNYAERLANKPIHLKEIADNTENTVLSGYGLKPDIPTHETMIPIVESIACGIPRVIVTNIQNHGNFVPGIPLDFEVEIPSLVSSAGIQGIRTDGLPRTVLAHLLRDRVAPVELELEAFGRGKRDLLTQLVMTDKWITSRKQAEDLIDEIFALPYHDELRKHYR